MSSSIARLWGGSALALVALSPWARLVERSLWPCAFKKLTGFPCPTCGTTRAAVALARLDFGSALVHYPLPAVAWIAFIGGGIAALAMTLMGRTPPAIPNRLSRTTRLVLVALVLANWVYSIATGV